jgi:4-hydroxyphenylacetate 3-monooxygenase/anthranilate 3-monooxygenase (FAD)/4-hydroxyphenylacetate 3-monooxygenase
MSIRNGEQYRRGLVDDRSIWFRGERIKDVGSHPAFRGKVDLVAALFDARDCNNKDVQGFSPEASSDCRTSFLIPRDPIALATRRNWSDWIARTTFGLMGRSPDYLQTAIMSFAAASEYFATNDSSFPQNVRDLHRHAASNDLFLARATVGPASNRGKAYSQQSDPFVNVGVVRETDRGIVLRGSKMISTNAAIADELLVFPISGFQKGDEDYALAFMIPVSTPGLKIICRDAFDDGTKDPEDFPITTRFEESDSLCVFDDVEVPWEKVFLCRDVEIANAMYGATCSRNFTGYQTLIRSIVKSEFYTAIAICCAELNGSNRHLHVQEMLGELISYCDVVKGLLALAEKSAYENEWGVYCPSSKPATSARVLFHKYSARMIEVIQTIAGGTLFALPTTLDLNAEIGPLVEKAFQTELDGWPSRKRIKVLKMAWELASDAFGQRQQVYEKYHAGDPFRIAAAHFAQMDRARSYELIEDALNTSRKAEPAISDEPAVLAARA